MSHTSTSSHGVIHVIVQTLTFKIAVTLTAAAVRHLHALDLCPVVLEPELHVLGLQLGELVAVLALVELVAVLVDHEGRRVGVLREPLLKLGYLRQRVDEHPRAPLPGLRVMVARLLLLEVVR